MLKIVYSVILFDAFMSICEENYLPNENKLFHVNDSFR